MKKKQASLKKTLATLLAVLLIISIPITALRNNAIEENAKPKEELLEYTVNFSNIGEDQGTYSATFEVGEEAIYDSEAPSTDKEGYEFEGWSTTPHDMDTIVANITPENATANTEYTYYAYYAPINKPAGEDGVNAIATTGLKEESVAAINEETVTIYFKDSSSTNTNDDKAFQMQYTPGNDLNTPFCDFTTPTYQSKQWRFYGWTFDRTPKDGTYFYYPHNANSWIPAEDMEKAIGDKTEITMYAQYTTLKPIQFTFTRETLYTATYNEQEQVMLPRQVIAQTQDRVNVPYVQDIKYTYEIISDPNNVASINADGKPVMTDVGTARIRVNATYEGMATPSSKEYNIVMKAKQLQVRPTGGVIPYGSALEDITYGYELYYNKSLFTGNATIENAPTNIVYNTEYDPSSKDKRNVGTHIVTMTSNDFSKVTFLENGVPTNNYVINTTTPIIEGALTVSPIDREITADSFVRSYKENNAPFTASADLVFEDQIADYVDLSFNSSATVDSLPNDYPITVSGTAKNGVLQNYNFTYKDGVLQVVENGTLAVLATPYGGTYDGDSHAALLNTNTSVPANLSYSVNGGEFTQAMPTLTNAGTYQVEILAQADGYADATSTQTVVINKKDASLIIDSFSMTQGDAEPTFTATSQGLVNNDALDYTLSRVAGDTPGEYAITANMQESLNYNVTVTNGLLTITAPVVALVIPPAATPAAIVPVAAAAAPTAAIEIADATAPLASVNEDDAQIQIGNENVPLSASVGEWSLVNLILSIVTAIISLVLMISYFKKENHKMPKLISLPIAALSIIMFILTQDTSLKMALVDEWTLTMAAVLIAQLALTLFIHKKNKDDEETPVEA